MVFVYEVRGEEKEMDDSRFPAGTRVRIVKDLEGECAKVGCVGRIIDERIEGFKGLEEVYSVFLPDEECVEKGLAGEIGEIGWAIGKFEEGYFEVIEEKEEREGR